MPATEPITPFNTGIPRVYGFRIRDEVDRHSMRQMASKMLDAFDAHEEVDMLLVFDTDKTSTPGASLSRDSLAAQMRSVANVRNYVVAKAPGQAGEIVETMGRMMPVQAKAFDSEEEALEWLKSQPAPEA